MILRNAESKTDAAGATTTPPVFTETLQQTIERLTAENNRLQGVITTRDAQDAQRAKEEELIAQKMRAGLTREQAIAVIARQRKHDEFVQSQWASRRPAIVEILKSTPDYNQARRTIEEQFAGMVSVEEIKAAQIAIKH